MGRGKSEFVIAKIRDDAGVYRVICEKDGKTTTKDFPFSSPNASLSAKIYAEMMQDSGHKYRVEESTIRTYVWERQ